MRAYYNEIDKFSVRWLRNLIASGLIPQGDVDDRSITDVQPGDLRGYDQCHFFAGIGGWAYALQLAEWGDEPVWTGSCPCQPFSVAGAGKGTSDERHLWPAFFRLISECRPPVVFGEQVAGKDGKIWLSGVRAEMESVSYAVGGADLCAASVGAPHIRQRLYWVANSTSARLRSVGRGNEGEGNSHCITTELDRWLDDSKGEGRCEGNTVRAGRSSKPGGSVEAGGLGDTCCDRHTEVAGVGQEPHRGRTPGRPSYAGWEDTTVIECGDGKLRRIPAEPALFPLAPGLSSGRVGLLRGSGNAIVPPLAAEFVIAFSEATGRRVGADRQKLFGEM